MAAFELLSAAREAAAAAARVLRENLGRVRVEEWSEKGVADFVTHVDRAAEAAIVQRVRAAFPDHRILAEEDASERGDRSGVTMGAPAGEYVWVIDPLDGTTNYLHAYPAYAVSIGVLRGGVPEAAVVLNGATSDEWTAVRNGGAFMNGARIAVSGIDRMARALIGTGFPFRWPELLPEYLPQLAAVLKAASGVRRAGSAALDLCQVASGRFDGFWELTLAPWDVAAGTLIVREAGGVVTRLDGMDTDVVGHGSILAGNTAIHAALGAIVRDAAVQATGPVAH